MPEAASRREYLFPIALATFWIVAGTFPYLYGYWSAGDDQVFMGFVGRGTPGANGYLMLARQVEQGNHLMENRVTPEPLQRIYVNLEWWLFGMAARIPGLSLMLVFHLGRVLTVPAFLLAVYYLASLCLNTVFERRFAVALVAFGSGFGWILLAANGMLGLDLEVSRDLKGVSVPAYMVNKPHFIRAGIFAALKYAFLLQAMRSGKMRYAVYCGLAAMGHSAIRPYHITDFYTMCALAPVVFNYWAGAWSWQRVRLGIAAGVVHLPAIGYYLWLAWTDALGMSGWARVPGFLVEYILWAGWPFALCCVGFLAAPWIFRLHQLRDGIVLLGLWMLIGWGFCNLYPYWGSGQEAVFFAFFIAGPMIAVAVLTQLLRWLPETYQHRPGWVRGIAVVLVLAATPSTLYVYAQFFTALHRPASGWAYYASQGFVDATRWLEANAETNEVVLASHDASQFIPRFTDNKTVTGHDMLTADYADKNADVARFFAVPGDEDFKQRVIRRYDVRYILWGDFERKLGGMQPGLYPWLDEAYRSGDVTVYRVTDFN